MIWPVYFDLNVSRRSGRKVAKELAVRNPTIDEIFTAAKKLGFNPIMENKSYPARWWRKEGRILIDKKAKKSEIIKKVAEFVKQRRQSK